MTLAGAPPVDEETLLRMDVNWSRLSEQQFRVDKWSLCGGRAAAPDQAVAIEHRMEVSISEFPIDFLFESVSKLPRSAVFTFARMTSMSRGVV